MELRNVLLLIFCVSHSHGCFEYVCYDKECTVAVSENASLTSDPECVFVLGMDRNETDVDCWAFGAFLNNIYIDSVMQKKIALNTTTWEYRRTYCFSNQCNNPMEPFKSETNMLHFNKYTNSSDERVRKCFSHLKKRLEMVYNKAMTTTTTVPTTTSPAAVFISTPSAPSQSNTDTVMPSNEVLDSAASGTTETPSTTTSDSHSLSSMVSIFCAALYYLIFK